MKISEINKEQIDKLQREFEDLEFKRYEESLEETEEEIEEQGKINEQ